jgi:hypothetical protein
MGHPWIGNRKLALAPDHSHAGTFGNACGNSFVPSVAWP